MLGRRIVLLVMVAVGSFFSWWVWCGRDRTSYRWNGFAADQYSPWQVIACGLTIVLLVIAATLAFEVPAPQPRERVMGSSYLLWAPLIAGFAAVGLTISWTVRASEDVTGFWVIGLVMFPVMFGGALTVVAIITVTLKQFAQTQPVRAIAVGAGLLAGVVGLSAWYGWNSLPRPNTDPAAKAEFAANGSLADAKTNLVDLYQRAAKSLADQGFQVTPSTLTSDDFEDTSVTCNRVVGALTTRYTSEPIEGDAARINAALGKFGSSLEGVIVSAEATTSMFDKAETWVLHLNLDRQLVARTTTCYFP